MGTKQTWGDAIRNTTDVELARFIPEVILDISGERLEFASNAWEKWLKEEAKEGHRGK